MRRIIVGIDGVPFHLLQHYANNNVMPYFKSLLVDGMLTEMHSSIPEISSVSWSSIITGDNPGEHGIYGFTDMLPGTYTTSFPNFINLKTTPFWNKQEKEQHAIINVPSTYPAKPLNGFMVSGFVALELEKALYPQSYLSKLQKMDYQIDVDSSKAHKSTSLFLEDLFYTLEKRIELYRYLWKKQHWDTFMLVFTGSDRLEHFLWNAYENKDHEYHEQFLQYFRRIDEIIGEISQQLTEDDSLIMVSDHGMEQIKVNVNINTYLQEQGFIQLGNKPEKKYRNMQPETQAFAMEPARIYLHKNKRFPKGTVSSDQEKKIVDDLVEALSSLTYNGKKVIRKVCKRDDIYHGPFVENAPDLVLLPNSGFSLRGGIGKQQLFEDPDIIVGMHTQQDAFLYVHGKENKDLIPRQPTVEDVVPILNGLQKR